MQLPESPLPAAQIAVADAQFATSCKQLVSIARINAAAVEAVLEPGTFDHGSEAEQHYAADAIAYGYAQIVHSLRCFQLLALDYECINANGSALTERG
jgi:hypothetical protein